MEIKNFFISLYTPSVITEDIKNYLNIAILPSIDSSHQVSLCALPSLVEIKNVINYLHPLKAPGIDGFHAIFYQKSWDLINEGLISEIRNIFNWSRIPPDWGKTLITLIPKIENASHPSHYRPIGLCQTQYKILSKLLANRIKPLLSNIISPFQGAYVKGQHTSDLFITA
ncbi:reverse transcriptase [Senna tora]|uniref:Reverse transcriptase n=1 Tax=Senna tora TaxID=362788 RepID=A0A834XIA5_9FABA|nr:reverse transcriptase [Senna tora]